MRRRATFCAGLQFGALLAAPSARAETPPSVAAPPSTTPVTAAPAGPLAAIPVDPSIALRARRRLVLVERDVGWGLAGAGIVGIATGAVIFGGSYSPDLRFDQGAENRTDGLIAMGVGLGLLVPGLVLALHGQKRLADVDWRLRAVAPPGPPVPEAPPRAPAAIRIEPALRLGPSALVLGARVRF